MGVGPWTEVPGGFERRGGGVGVGWAIIDDLYEIGKYTKDQIDQVEADNASMHQRHDPLFDPAGSGPAVVQPFKWFSTPWVWTPLGWYYLTTGEEGLSSLAANYLNKPPTSPLDPSTQPHFRDLWATQGQPFRLAHPIDWHQPPSPDPNFPVPAQWGGFGKLPAGTPIKMPAEGALEAACRGLVPASSLTEEQAKSYLYSLALGRDCHLVSRLPEGKDRNWDDPEIRLAAGKGKIVWGRPPPAPAYVEKLRQQSLRTPQEQAVLALWDRMQADPARVQAIEDEKKRAAVYQAAAGSGQGSGAGWLIALIGLGAAGYGAWRYRAPIASWLKRKVA